MRTSFLLAAFFSISIHSTQAAPSANVSNFISQYRSIATEISLKQGIPVSIVLGQAMLESNCGKSDLSVNAKNFFGVKWRKGMPYERVSKHDDDYVNGKLVESYFVKYNSPEESFQHYAYVLSRSTYQALYQYERTDYRNWAHGLQKAGYATNPQYAMELIKVIENNNLQRFDIPKSLSPDDYGTETATAQTHTDEDTLDMIIISGSVETPKNIQQQQPSAKKMPATIQTNKQIKQNDEQLEMIIISSSKN